MDNIIVRRVLKGTGREITLELTRQELAHLLLVEAVILVPGTEEPFDLCVHAEMAVLADHFERPDHER